MSRQISERVSVQSWGYAENKEVLLYTLKNKSGQEVDISSFGATIVGFRTPDKSGQVKDVVLGFDSVAGYQQQSMLYFGSTVGRVANRIRRGKFTLNGREYTLNLNQGQNSLHGGAKGWHVYAWNSDVQNDILLLTLLSEDGNEGYPGDVVGFVSYELKDDGSLEMLMKAFTTKATPVNMTNHVYFNLAGHNANAAELVKHEVMLNADRWTVADDENVTTGEIKSVAGTPMDLRNKVSLGMAMKNVPARGFDNNFCVADFTGEMKLVATFRHPDSGRSMEVYSNQPGYQFYTSDNLPDVGTTGIAGKDSSAYFKYGGFCLETQNFPNAINLPNFPNSVLRPGQMYNHMVTYKFGVK